MQFDIVYQEIGEFGRFSKFIVFLGAFSNFYAGFLFLISIFTLGIPEHRCAIPGWENDTYALQSDLHLHAINRTIPMEPMEASPTGVVYNKCSYKTVTEDGQINHVKCDRWVYDTSFYESSLAADLNMVCDRSILKSNSQMVFFGGLLSGSFLTGVFSDRFGRKPTLCISSLFCFLAALGIAWTPNYIVYVLLTFCVGFFSIGTIMPAFVMGMEFVGPSKRGFAAFVHQLYWGLGNIVLAGLAYGVRDWKTLQIICAAPGILFQLFWVVFPESPRWLYTKGRIEESKTVLRKAAKWEKVDLPDRFFDMVFKESQTPKQKNICHLFTSRILLTRTMVIFINWIVVCLTYYGLALNSGDLGMDIYLTFLLQTLMDVLGSVITVFAVDKTGRKPFLAGSMLLGGLGCISTVFTMIFAADSMVITTVFAMVGKLGACASFLMVYLYSAELFPTVVRNAAMGSSSCMARVGGMLAPYIADLDRLVAGSIGKALPQIIFGALSITAGLLVLHLPETLNRDLPETIKDGEMFGRKKEIELENPNKEVYIYKAIDDIELKTHAQYHNSED